MLLPKQVSRAVLLSLKEGVDEEDFQFAQEYSLA